MFNRSACSQLIRVVSGVAGTVARDAAGPLRRCQVRLLDCSVARERMWLRRCHIPPPMQRLRAEGAPSQSLERLGRRACQIPKAARQVAYSTHPTSHSCCQNIHFVLLCQKMEDPAVKPVLGRSFRRWNPGTWKTSTVYQDNQTLSCVSFGQAGDHLCVDFNFRNYRTNAHRGSASWHWTSRL